MKILINLIIMININSLPLDIEKIFSFKKFISIDGLIYYKEKENPNSSWLNKISKTS